MTVGSLDRRAKDGLDWTETRGGLVSPSAKESLMSLESTPASAAVPAPVRKPRAREQPSPALVLLDLLLIAVFLGLTFLLGAFPLKDTDFWWHLRTGDLIRQTGAVPQTDLYTFGAAGHPWIDLHWGYQVALSLGFARGGVVVLNLAKCAITCLAVFFLITARRRDWPVWVVVLAWIPALLVLGGRMYIRPETLTLLYLAIVLAILFRWDRYPMLALLLPVVQLAWVNSHGLFVLGPVLLGFALLDALLRKGALARERRRWWRIIALATFLTGLACLFNPYGLRGALYPLQLARTMGNPLFARTIAELTPIPLFIQRSAGWRNLPLQLHIATMILGALSFLIPLFWTVLARFRTAGSTPPPAPARRRSRKREAEPVVTTWRLSPLRLLLFATFSALSWQATRNSHQFAAVVGALTAWNFAEWAAAVRRRADSAATARFRSDADAGAAAPPGLWPRLATLGCLTALFVLVATGKFYAWAGEGRTVGLGEEPLWFPHAAVQFAGQPGMPQRFVSYHDGYAAVYEYHNGPQRKVFVDARLEVMGADLYERYLSLRRRIKDDDPSWARELDSYERPAVYIGHASDADLGAVMVANPSWRCVWFDPIGALFVHRSFTGVVERYGVDFAARHFARDPAADPQGIPALEAAAEALWKYANGLEARGRRDRGRPLVLLGLDYARRISQALPESQGGWKLLGKLEMAREPIDAALAQRFRLPFDPVLDLAVVRATYDLRRAFELGPRDFLTLLLLEGLYEVRGMDEEAVDLLARLGQTVPINPLQAEQIEAARARRAQLEPRLGPPAPSSWENLSELERSVAALLAHGRARSAAEHLALAYPAEPRPWEVTDRLATLWLHLGAPERARALWEKALAPPRSAVRSSRVAFAHLVEGSFDTARAGFREALRSEPDQFEAWYGLALLEQDAGRAAEARAAALRAVALAPAPAARAAAESILSLVTPYAAAGDSQRTLSPPPLPVPDRDKTKDEVIRR
jgi:tetratricopeptide (TPR) repeat protein